MRRLGLVHLSSRDSSKCSSPSNTPDNAIYLTDDDAKNSQPYRRRTNHHHSQPSFLSKPYIDEEDEISDEVIPCTWEPTQNNNSNTNNHGTVDDKENNFLSTSKTSSKLAKFAFQKTQSPSNNSTPHQSNSYHSYIEDDDMLDM